MAWDYSFVAGHEQIRWVALLCLLIFLGMTVFFLIAFSQRLSRFLALDKIGHKVKIVHRLLEAFQRFGKNRAIIGGSVLVSLFSQVFAMIFFYQLARIVGEDAVTWKSVLFAVPMGFLVTAIPIAPAGIGVGQVAFHYLFQIYLQKPTQFGATAITAYQLSMVFWAMVGALFYLRRSKPRELEEAVAELA
ncbi:MAG: hypothetical protein HC902_13410 [Calothrix sp. SM1_5_4]|nr:hypothetical protein [Calothrix sp. SM1_5_4]